MAMTTEQKKAAGERLKAARAAKKAQSAPEPKAAAEAPAEAPSPQEAAPVAKTVPAPSEWVEAQEGLRWVKMEESPVYACAERNSFLEASGYDNNFEKRAISAFQRCLNGCLRVDKTPNPARVPEFSPELEFEVSFRFVPKR